MLAALLFAGAKVVATALVARLFMLTQPALMQIGWFAWAYDTIMPWKEALVERVRASWVWRVSRLWKERAKRAVIAQERTWRPAWLKLKVVMIAASRRLRAQLRRLGAGNPGALGGAPALAVPRRTERCRQIRLAPMLMASASTAVLKKNEMMACSVTSRRRALVRMAMSEVCEAAPIDVAK